MTITITIMYSMWELDISRPIITKVKITVKKTELERDRRTNSVELVKSMVVEARSDL